VCACLSSTAEQNLPSSAGKKVHVLFLQRKMPLHIAVFYYVLPAFSAFFLPLKQHTERAAAAE
jgi:hypothetical protein